MVKIGQRTFIRRKRHALVGLVFQVLSHHVHSRHHQISRVRATRATGIENVVRRWKAPRRVVKYLALSGMPRPFSRTCWCHVEFCWIASWPRRSRCTTRLLSLSPHGSGALLGDGRSESCDVLRVSRLMLLWVAVSTIHRRILSMWPMSAQGSNDGTKPTTSVVVFFRCVPEGADHAAPPTIEATPMVSGRTRFASDRRAGLALLQKVR